MPPSSASWVVHAADEVSVRANKKARVKARWAFLLPGMLDMINISLQYSNLFSAFPGQHKSPRIACKNLHSGLRSHFVGQSKRSYRPDQARGAVVKLSPPRLNFPQEK